MTTRKNETDNRYLTQYFLHTNGCRILDNGRKLQVVDAQLLDMGTYKCIASNAAGNATKEFSLGILGKNSTVKSDYHKYTNRVPERQ